LIESQTDLNFENKNEVGEIGKFGKYKGRPVPYGSAEFSTFDADKLAIILDENIKKLRLYHAETIVLHLDVYHDGQCNIELSRDFIKKISDIQIPLTISCYATDEEE
jgi:hypothetical protein